MKGIYNMGHHYFIMLKYRYTVTFDRKVLKSVITPIYIWHGIVLYNIHFTPPCNSPKWPRKFSYVLLSYDVSCPFYCSCI